MRGKSIPNLNWVKLRFNKDNRVHVPKSKGIYAFVLEVDSNLLMNNAYVLYVGKAGDIKSKNTLFKRYGDYLRNLRMNDRIRISEMLNRWNGHLSYYYSEVPEDISTGDIEKILLDIFIPPFNTNDFSFELKSLLKGAGLLRIKNYFCHAREAQLVIG